ncbi:hypothetical protein GCM10025865_20280 [Paraoerskovia sediminicola]|uniref:Glycosyltransferase 2-like domain-containing protein n=1 Tax=Paraoerskovia sediminicola TaxID=1138587 RepID=A0ABM8G3K5_9CELL|nr:hypothetical protein GCM10025865_20280 [Paraoerskovia sediminicola]
MQLTVVIPTFNEEPNVAELVRRVTAAVEGIDAEILFVDDSTDDTPRTIERVARDASIRVRMIHRVDGVGGSAAPWSRASRPPTPTGAS